MKASTKKTVRGDEVPQSEEIQKLEAVNAVEAEKLAVTRHQKINLIWERTQQFIALVCVLSSVFSSLYLIVFGKDAFAERGYQFLTNVGLLVIGFYFGRTNHTRPTGEDK